MSAGCGPWARDVFEVWLAHLSGRWLSAASPDGPSVARLAELRPRAIVVVFDLVRRLG